MEKWKDISGYEGFYRVSDCGQIKSIKQQRADKGWIKERILKPYSNKDRYLIVDLRKNSRRKTYKIHRLVLETFVGPCPPGMQCRHLDGNPRNNKLSNLRWGTPKEDAQDRIRHGTINRGERNGNAKITKEQVLESRQLREIGWTYKKLAKEYNVGLITIWNAVNQKRWRHI